MKDFKRKFEERIAALAQISEEADQLTRHSLTPTMKKVNTIMRDWMRTAGMTVREDNIGNLIGRYEGATPDAKTLMIGSHLDTVRNAGKYDGALGVILGLMCVEALTENNERLPFAIEIIAFCDEEGLRFNFAYLGSRVIAGSLHRGNLHWTDAEGITIAEAIREYGGSPDKLYDDRKLPQQLIGYLEAHIEQGPVLESLNLPVGIVTGIIGQSRLELHFNGTAGHAGTVPMNLRHDALCAAARFIIAVQTLARETPDLVATVGQVQVKPGASNVIPGRVTATLDVRHANDQIREQAIATLRERTQAIVETEKVTVEWKTISESPTIRCADGLITALTQAAQQAGVTPHLVGSGAGHDAVIMSQITPVGMLFVRCRGGISHNPAEFADAADVEIALNIFLDALRLLANHYKG